MVRRSRDSRRFSLVFRKRPNIALLTAQARTACLWANGREFVVGGGRTYFIFRPLPPSSIFCTLYDPITSFLNGVPLSHAPPPHLLLSMSREVGSTPRVTRTSSYWMFEKKDDEPDTGQQGVGEEDDKDDGDPPRHFGFSRLPCIAL